MILQRNDKQPVPPSLGTICLPKGHSTTAANLKHCKPQGIPMMEMHNTNPPIMYPMAAARPPNSSQMILPSKLMMPVFYVFLYIKTGKQQWRLLTSTQLPGRTARPENGPGPIPL